MTLGATELSRSHTTPAPELLTSLATQARTRPSALAVSCGSQSLDYAELSNAVERMARALQTVGVESDDVVAMTAERTSDNLILILAILHAGAACMPLDASYPAARLNVMLEAARPDWLIASGTLPVTLSPAIPTLSRSDLESHAGTDTALALAAAIGERIYVLFTSGSSGKPKGVAMRTAVLERLVSWHVAHPRLGQAARTLQFAPFSFDVAFQETLSTFATGGALIMPSEAERRDPFALLELIASKRVERLFVPYVALQAIAEAVSAGSPAPATLRDVITAGEQLRITPAIRALFAVLPECVLHNHYGPTETHVVTAHELSGDPALWPELPPIGRALPHVRTKLVDATMHAVASGHEGELLLGGDCLAAGYIHQPELTAERFVELGGARWYHSGDAVRDRGDGLLEYLGRLDQQIKLGGYRIEPAEIETVLCRHPSVTDAVVVAAGDAQSRRLVAHVVPRGAIKDETLTAQLIAHCAAQLADYLVPQRFVMHAALPLTASGKIDRRMLSSTVDAVLRWPADAPLERQLQELWKQLLDLDELDENANLFDLGARSLTVVRAMTELRRHGHRAITAVQMYEHPSVAGLAALLSGVGVPASSIAAAQTRGDRQRAALARFNRGTGKSR